MLFDKYKMNTENIFINSKYKRWYISIVEKDWSSFSGYKEKHHKIPRSLGGTNSKENIVSLPAKAHFICHKLLVKITTGDNKRRMAHALNMLAKANNKNQSRHTISSFEYEKIRKILSESMQGENNPMYGKPAPNRNKTHNEETRKKLSEANRVWNERNPGARRGKLKPEETRQKLRRPKTEKEKENMSIAAKLKPRLICIHCGISVTTSNHTRWHGSNCKKAP